MIGRSGDTTGYSSDHTQDPGRGPRTVVKITIECLNHGSRTPAGVREFTYASPVMSALQASITGYSL